MPEMTTTMPSVCRIVLYTLSERDAERINADRSERDVVANLAEAGQSFPAVVVRTFGGEACNLKVLLDGPDSFWATSRGEDPTPEAGSYTPGYWAWPPRA